MCIFVRRALTFVEHSFIENSAIKHSTLEVIVGKKHKERIFIAMVHSNPTHRNQRFRALLHRANLLAAGSTLLIWGEFNAPHQDWEYPTTTVNGCNLREDATEAGCSWSRTRRTPRVLVHQSPTIPPGILPLSGRQLPPRGA